MGWGGMKQQVRQMHKQLVANSFTLLTSHAYQALFRSTKTPLPFILRQAGGCRLTRYMVFCRLHRHEVAPRKCPLEPDSAQLLSS